MLTEYSKIVNLLQECSTNNVKQAENELKSLAAMDLRVLSCLKHVLQDPTLSGNMCTLATSTINSIYVSFCAEYAQEFSYAFFTNLLEDSCIEIKNKKELSRSLMYCLQQCDQQYLAKWKTFTNHALLDIDNYQVGLLLLTAFSCSEIRDNIIEQLGIEPFQFSMQVLCAKVDTGAIDYNQVLYIFEVWKIVVEYLIHYCAEHAINFFIEMADSTHFRKALQYSILDLSTGDDRHVLYLDEQNLDIETIQEIKKSALELQRHVIKQIGNDKRRFNTQVFNFTGENIQIFVNTLCLVAQDSSLREKFDIDEALICMLQLISSLSFDCPQILCRSWKYFLHFVVFPFLAITDDELADFQENTNSFVELSEDVCGKQQMGVLKTEVANFLEKITDLSPYIEKAMKIYNFLSEQTKTSSQSKSQQHNSKQSNSMVGKYVVNYCIASIKHNLGMQFMPSNNYLKHNVVLPNAPIMPVESALLVLSLYSYCLDSFPTQMQEIRVILCHDKVKILPPLERARIYVFLAFNYQEIFTTDNQQEVTTHHFWIELALKQENHPTVAYCALDFVTNLMHKFYNENIVAMIISKVPKCTTPNFWPLLRRMIHSFIGSISEQMLISLVQQCYTRINFQIESQSSKQVKTTYIITSILQVFRAITENGRLFHEMPDLKALLWGVHQLYLPARALFFQDEVVKIINNFLFYASNDEIRHPEVHNLLSNFIVGFTNSEYECTYYYIAFNHFITKGDLQTAVIPIYEVLKQGLKFFLLGKNGKKRETNRKKLPIGHTLLLIQNILAIHGDKLAPLQQVFLFEVVKELLPKQRQRVEKGKSKDKLIVYDRTLAARALNTQYLCHMYNPNQEVIRNLRKYHQCKLYYGYDVSVLLSCIKLTIFKEKQLVNIYELLTLCVNVIYYYFEMDTAQKIEKVNEYERKMGADSDADNRIEEEENQAKAKKNSALLIRIKRYTDYEVILAYINTPFLKNSPKVLGHTKNVKQTTDIRKQFSDLLMETRNLNQPLFESFIDGLSDVCKHRLQSILQMKIPQILEGRTLHPAQRRQIFTVKTPKLGFIEEKHNEQMYESLQKESHRHNYKFHQEDQQNQEPETKLNMSLKKKMLKKKLINME